MVNKLKSFIKEYKPIKLTLYVYDSWPRTHNHKPIATKRKGNYYPMKLIESFGIPITPIQPPTIIIIHFTESEIFWVCEYSSSIIMNEPDEVFIIDKEELTNESLGPNNNKHYYLLLDLINNNNNKQAILHCKYNNNAIQSVSNAVINKHNILIYNISNKQITESMNIFYTDKIA